jgi:hypothetical protein
MIRDRRRIFFKKSTIFLRDFGQIVDWIHSAPGYLLVAVGLILSFSFVCAMSGTVYTRFVEIGRVGLVNFGDDYGKLVTIIDVLDSNRVWGASGVQAPMRWGPVSPCL